VIARIQASADRNITRYGLLQHQDQQDQTVNPERKRPAQHPQPDSERDGDRRWTGLVKTDLLLSLPAGLRRRPIPDRPDLIPSRHQGAARLGHGLGTDSPPVPLITLGSPGTAQPSKTSWGTCETRRASHVHRIRDAPNR
jgi:hypothetical protein